MLLNAVVEDRCVSSKPENFDKDCSDAVADSNSLSTTRKSDAISAALRQSCIIFLPEGSSVTTDTMITPTSLKPRWAENLGNNPNKINQECIIKIKELHVIGKNNKKESWG